MQSRVDFEARIIINVEGSRDLFHLTTKTE